MSETPDGYTRKPRTRQGISRLHREPHADSKTCCGCGKHFTIDEFSWNSGAKGRKYRSSECKSCKAARTRAYLATPRGIQNQKRNNLLRLYGIGLDVYEDLLVKQNGLCAICGKNETVRKSRGKGVRPLGLDHNHTTGASRGLLCATCNNGLGCFKDDLSLLQSAIDYLKLHSPGS